MNEKRFGFKRAPNRLLGILLSAFLLSALLAPGAFAAELLDQKQEVFNGAVSVPGGFTQSQTFTAGLSGALTRLSVYAANPFSAMDLVAEVQGVTAAGEPDGVALASQSLSLSSPSSAQWVEIAFAHPASVMAGAPYAIILKPTDTFAWSKASTGPYAGGQAWTGDGESWWQEQGDYAFRTYVDDAPVVEEPTPDPAPGAPGKVTGGGWLADGEGKGHFDLDVASGQQGDLTGSGRYGFRSAEGVQYEVRITQWLALSADHATGEASFSGSAAAAQIDPATGEAVALREGYTMSVALVDGPDSLQVIILDQGGEIWHQVAGPVLGGQVKVHAIGSDGQVLSKPDRKKSK